MILYITRKYPPSIGGMQRFNRKLVKHLRTRTDFLLLSWGRSQRLMPFFLIYAVFTTLTLGLRKKIDLIYLADGMMSPLGVLFKKLLFVPVVVSIHGRDIAFNFPGYLTVVSWSLRRMDRLICVSEQLKKECLKRGVKEKNITVIPNGVEVDDFAWTADIPPDKYLGIEAQNKTVLITVGRLVPKKGVDRFVRDILPAIVREAPDVLYLVVGDGPLRKNIEALVKEKGLEDHVRLMGDIPMEDERLKAAYNCAAIFVMPNVEVRGDIEGFGIVALEGGAASLAVVASRLQGIQEAITEGQNGILLPWDDAGAHIKTLLELIKDPERTKRLGESARRFVRQHYGWDKIAGRYLEEFQSLQSGEKSSSPYPIPFN